jgi:hypothetical protein
MKKKTHADTYRKKIEPFRRDIIYIIESISFCSMSFEKKIKNERYFYLYFVHFLPCQHKYLHIVVIHLSFRCVLFSLKAINNTTAKDNNEMENTLLSLIQFFCFHDLNLKYFNERTEKQ